MRISKVLVVLGFGVFAAACSESPVSPTATGSPRFSATDNDGAIVINQVTLRCGTPGSDANGNRIFGGIGTVTTVVENGNKVMLKCKGEGITNLSGRGQNFDGFRCRINKPSGGSVSVIDTHATVSASGNGSLTCTYDKP